MTTTRSTPSRRRLVRSAIATVVVGGAVLVGSTAGTVSAGAPPEHSVSLSNEGCTLNIEATVAQAGSYVVEVWYDAELQEDFDVNASDGPGTFDFTHETTPGDGYEPTVSVNLRLVEGGTLATADHTVEGCIQTTTTTTTSTTSTTVAGETTTTATTAPPSGGTPTAPAAAGIAGRATYTG